MDIDIMQNMIKTIQGVLSLTEQHKQRYLFSLETVLTPLQIFVYTYIFPPLCLLCIVLFGAMIYTVYEKDMFKIMKFMTVYTALDFSAMIISGTVMSIFLNLKRKYIVYDYCYFVLIICFHIQAFFYTCSQWLKVGHAYQRTIVILKPLDHKRYTNRKIFIVCAIVVTIVSATNVVLSSFGDKLEKAFAKDTTNNIIVETCRFKNTFVRNSFIEQITFASRVVDVTVSDILPLIGMLSLSHVLIRSLRRQAQFRAKFKINQAKQACNISRITRVIVLLNICFTVISVFSFCSKLLLLLNIDNSLVLDIMTTTATFSYVLSLPITVTIFFWLRVGYRSKIKKAFKCLTCKEN